jgi:hypothetical protein
MDGSMPFSLEKRLNTELSSISWILQPLQKAQESEYDPDEDNIAAHSIF